MLNLFGQFEQFKTETGTRDLWHMNEGSGTTLKEETSGNDGTISGATYIKGKFVVPRLKSVAVKCYKNQRGLQWMNQS